MQSCSCLSCRISCSTVPGVMCTSPARHLHIVCMSSTHVRMLSAPGHIICTLSAGHLHHSSWSPWAWTIFYCDRNLLLNGICGRNVEFVSFQDHVNDLRDNLCCWFSLHVKSRHCSHLICICTCHLHIIWAYAYYAHIICSGPWYLPS